MEKDPIKRKACQKAWYAANKERVSQYNKERWITHHEVLSARNKKWREANRERLKESLKNWHSRTPGRQSIYAIKKNYGVTLKEAEQLAERRKRGCEICGSTKRPVIDHNHTTGKVRGILCSGCNVAVGHSNENPTTLRALADYLEANAS